MKAVFTEHEWRDKNSSVWRKCITYDIRRQERPRRNVISVTDDSLRNCWEIIFKLFCVKIFIKFYVLIADTQARRSCLCVCVRIHVCSCTWRYTKCVHCKPAIVLSNGLCIEQYRTQVQIRTDYLNYVRKIQHLIVIRLSDQVSYSINVRYICMSFFTIYIWYHNFYKTMTCYYYYYHHYYYVIY